MECASCLLTLSTPLAERACVSQVTEHPLVTVHPETQERVLNCSPSFLKQIQGLHPRESEAPLGLGRIVAGHHRASTSHQNREHIRCLYF